MTHKPDFERAKAYALERLARELSSDLHYHSVVHTRDEVVPAIERFAAGEGVDGEALLLLRTAAYYHDIGFVEQPEDHEAIGVRIAGEALPRFRYDSRQIERIGEIILATRLPHAPRNLLEELIADADLNTVAGRNFLARNFDLRAELAAHGTEMTDAQWYESQIRFLRQHCYWTASARQLCEPGKRDNIAQLEKLLAACRARAT